MGVWWSGNYRNQHYAFNVAVLDEERIKNEELVMKHKEKIRIFIDSNIWETRIISQVYMKFVTNYLKESWYKDYLIPGLMGHARKEYYQSFYEDIFREPLYQLMILNYAKTLENELLNFGVEAFVNNLFQDFFNNQAFIGSYLTYTNFISTCYNESNSKENRLVYVIKSGDFKNASLVTPKSLPIANKRHLVEYDLEGNNIDGYFHQYISDHSIVKSTFDIGDIVSVSSGSHHTLVLDSNGHLYGLGSNEHYQLGLTSSSYFASSSSPPKFVHQLTRIEYYLENNEYGTPRMELKKLDIRAIHCTGNRSFIITKDGDVYQTGKTTMNKSTWFSVDDSSVFTEHNMLFTGISFEGEYNNSFSRRIVQIASLDNETLLVNDENRCFISSSSKNKFHPILLFEQKQVILSVTANHTSQVFTFHCYDKREVNPFIKSDYYTLETPNPPPNGLFTLNPFNLRRNFPFSSQFNYEDIITTSIITPKQQQQQKQSKKSDIKKEKDLTIIIDDELIRDILTVNNNVVVSTSNIYSIQHDHRKELTSDVKWSESEIVDKRIATEKQSHFFDFYTINGQEVHEQPKLLHLCEVNHGLVKTSKDDLHIAVFNNQHIHGLTVINNNNVHDKVIKQVFDIKPIGITFEAIDNMTFRSNGDNDNIIHDDKMMIKRTKTPLLPKPLCYNIYCNKYATLCEEGDGNRTFCSSGCQKNYYLGVNVRNK